MPVGGILTAVAALVVLVAPAAAQVQVDAGLPDYKVVGGVSGSIKSVGSDTMNNLMTLWSEQFKKWYPNVQVEIEGKGSSTAPPALIEGQATFGPMSRKMKEKEIDEFESAFGYKPVPMRTAIDMIGIYVHKDNPIAKKGLTLQQLDAIFSKTRNGGHPADIRTWGDVGLTGEWADKPISLYGRNSASGTYGYVKKHALFKGDYKDEVKEQPGSSAVVQGVASDKYGIGYSGIGYKTADVAVVPLAKEPGVPFAPAAADSVEQYPLARFLYLYVNYKPGSDLDPLRKEFLKLVFSKPGQEVVIKDGYLPINAGIARQDLAKIGVGM
jgi:phosphate transport system substrate-binding protein